MAGDGRRWQAMASAHLDGKQTALPFCMEQEISWHAQLGIQRRMLVGMWPWLKNHQTRNNAVVECVAFILFSISKIEIQHAEHDYRPRSNW